MLAVRLAVLTVLARLLAGVLAVAAATRQVAAVLAGRLTVLARRLAVLARRLARGLARRLAVLAGRLALLAVLAVLASRLALLTVLAVLARRLAATVLARGRGSIHVHKRIHVYIEDNEIKRVSRKFEPVTTRVSQCKPMRILFFDTETNGLPKSRYGTPQDLANWPRVIQIAWQIWEFNEGTDPVKIDSLTFLIKPDYDLVWNTGSEEIHKISKNVALLHGEPGINVFTSFYSALKKSDVAVAHNLAFDKPVVLAELLRSKLDISAWPSIEYCTCLNTKELVKLPAKYPKAWDPYKLPKLPELYSFLYSGDGVFEFHSAAGDVECLYRCFLELTRRRFVPLETWGRNLRVLTERDKEVESKTASVAC